MLEGGREAVAADEDVVGTSKVCELERVHTPCAPAKRLRPTCEVVVAPPLSLLTLPNISHLSPHRCSRKAATAELRGRARSGAKHHDERSAQDHCAVFTETG
jgi:hypothetical protein